MRYNLANILKSLSHSRPENNLDAAPGRQNLLGFQIFDPDFYISQIGYDFSSTEALDLYHDYSVRGFMFGYDPCPLFSTQFVQHFCPNLDPEEEHPLELWIERKLWQEVDPHPLFDCSFYSEEYDLADDVDPLHHYLTKGIQSGSFISSAHKSRFQEVLGEQFLKSAGLTQVDSGFPDFELMGVFRDGLSTANVPFKDFDISKYDLVSFDLWETLVQRRRHPEAGKLETCLKIKNRATNGQLRASQIYDCRVAIEKKIGASRPSDEYKLREVLTELIDFLDGKGFLSGSVGDRGVLVHDLANEEVLSEGQAAEVRPGAVRLLTEAASSDADVAIFSDHYFSTADLRDVLRLAGLGDISVDVYTSSESLTSKRLGSAFQMLAGRYSAGSRIHIGDNKHSDVENALDSGFDSLQIRRAPEVDLSDRNAGDYDPRQHLHRFPLRDGAFRLTEEVSALTRRARAIGESPAYCSGISHTLLPLCLVLSSVARARALGTDRVFYLGREGQFLASIHSKLERTDVTGGISPVTLKVSRRSVFPAALAVGGDLLLDRAAAQYRTQTVAAFIRMLGLERESRISEIVKKYDLGFEEVIPDTRGDSRLQELLRDQEFKHLLTENSQEQHALLREYLGVRGIDIESPQNLVVCDIGWRGTVQDLLATAFPDLHLHGNYLALFPFFLKNPSNSEKYAVAVDFNVEEGDVYIDPPAAIEGPWTVLRPSPLHYRRSPSGGVSVFEDEFVPEPSDALVKDFQQGVLDSCCDVAQFMTFFGLDADDLRWLLNRQLRSFFKDVPNTVSDIWFERPWDESFGSGVELPYAKMRPNSELLRPDIAVETSPQAIASKWIRGWKNWSPIVSVSVLRGLIDNEV